MKITKKFVVEVQFDDSLADEEGIAVALDTLVETATSTPGILDDCGQVTVGEFFPAGYVNPLEGLV